MPITIFAGHYGSGKTQISLNWAFYLKNRGEKAVLCDLDIVNPYFRTTDAKDFLESAGIPLIAPLFANTNLESPSIPASVNAVFDNDEISPVIDLGGDDRGMTAIGRYSDRLKKAGYNLWLVVNKYRILSSNTSDTSVIIDEMERAAGLAFTGIINNSNLGASTTAADVEASAKYAAELSSERGLPLIMTTVKRSIAGLVRCDNIFPLDIYLNRYRI